MKKNTVFILFATIVTTRAIDLQFDRPQVLVYEVSEGVGDTPHVELLKVEDINAPSDEDNIVKILQLDGDKKQNRDLSIKKNKHTFNRYQNSYGSKKYRHNDKNWIKLGDLDQFKLQKNTNNNYKSHKHRNNQNDDRVYELEYLLNKKDNLYKRNKNKNRDIKRNQYDSYIKLDDQYSTQGNRNSNNQKLNSLWQISDYIQQQSKKNNRYNNKNDKPYHRHQFADNNPEYETTNAQSDALLSQILSPVKRSKREAERLSILKRVKQLVKRLKQLDDDNDARLEGQVFVTKLDGLSKWDNSRENSEFKDKTGQRLSIDDLKRVLEGNRHQNPLNALRMGNEVEVNEEDAAVVEDRTAPPQKRDVWEFDD